MNQITKREDNSVDTLIQKAIESNVPVESLQRLLLMRETLLKEKAKTAFIQAMSDFQKKCPVIEKKKKVMNKDGTTIRYKYAPIDSIVEQIQKPLGESGLAYTWTVKNETGKITATCKVTHIEGHSEESSFEIPIDSEGYMTAPQKVASALTFAKRYSLCNALGISTGDEDTDAVDVKKEPEAKSVKSKIILRLKTLGEETGTKEKVALAVNKLTKLELVENNYEEIATRLEVLVGEQNENSKV